MSADGQVDDWLNGLGLGRFASAFAAAEVDFDTLPHLTQDDLAEMGISAIGPRRKLLTAIVALRAPGRETGAPPALDDQSRRHLTVLFADIVGSTALSRMLDPEQMQAILWEFFALLDSVVARYGGHLANKLGDGAMVYFGYPVAQEDAGVRAVLTAADLVREVPTRLAAPDGTPVQIRCGLASGVVVVGGLDEASSAVGDTLNIAARVQDLAGPGAVVLADSTERLVRHRFPLRALGQREIRGVERGIPVFQVPLAGVAAQLVPPLREASGAMYGRDSALASLRAAWAGRTDKARCVQVAAAAGMGKTRLIKALVADLPQDVALRHYTGAPYHSAVPFSPFLKHLELDDPDARDDALRQSLAPAADNIVALDARARRKASITGFVRRALRDVPPAGALLVFDDLQHFDPSSLEVLDRIVAAAGPGVMIVAATRDPASGLSNPEIEIVLTALEAPAMLAIARDRGGDLPEPALQDLARRADGVPLFAEELIRDVQDRLRLGEDAESAIAALPATLQDSLQTRMESLGPGKPVLHAAATFGAEAPLDVLEALYTGPDFRRALDDVVSSGLAERRAKGLSMPGACLVFRHQLMLECAYGTITRQRRRGLHGRIADILGQRALPGHHIRAHHLTEADRLSDAAKAWADAARAAADRSADAEACVHWRRALALVPRLTDPDTADAFEADALLGYLPSLIGAEGYGAHVTHSINRAVALTEARGAPAQAFAALFLRWISLLARGDIDVAHTFAARLEGLVARTETAVERLAFLRMLGSTGMFRGNLNAASGWLDAFVRQYRPDIHAEGLAAFGATDNFTTVQCCRICIAALRGDVIGSQSIRDETIDTAENLGRVHNLGHVLGYGSAFSSALQYDWDNVVTAATRLEALATQYSLPFWQALSDLHLGMADVADGQRGPGLRRFDRGRDWCRNQGVGFLLPSFHVLCAGADWHRGEGRIGLDALSDLDTALDDGERWLRPELLRLRALAAARLGQNSFAGLLLARAVSLAQEQDNRLFRVRAVGTRRALGLDRERRLPRAQA